MEAPTGSLNGTGNDRNLRKAGLALKIKWDWGILGKEIREKGADHGTAIAGFKTGDL